MPAPPTAPPKPSPPRPQTASNTNPTTSRSNGTPRTFGSSSGVTADVHKVCIYGSGGVGKSKLASLLKDAGARPKFIDIEDGSGYLDVERISPTPETWDELLQVLRDDSLWQGIDAVVVDSLTKAEELAVAWTLANVPHPDKQPTTYVKSVEGYGYGKGYGFVYDTFLHLLQELDRHARAGRHIITVAHECTSNVPNPAGEDFLRYEPRLQSPSSGKASIRHRVKEWVGHLLYIGYDIAVDQNGKATGVGSRCIYTQEMPTWWAKSRSLSDSIVYTDGDAELWNQLLKKGS